MDFCTRVETVNKRVLEALIKVSAFACVEPNISTLLSTYESCLNRSQTIRKEKKSGQGSMFSGFIDTQIVDHLESANIHVDQSDQLRFEKEFLGVYLSGHPLDQYKDRVTKWNSQMISEDHVDELISILGFVIQVRRVLSKNKQEMIIAKLEDAHGDFDILLFSADDVEKFSEFLIEGRILMVTGKVRLSRDKASLNCQNIEVLDQMSKANAIHINMISIDPFGQFERIKQALIDSSGSCPVYIHWNHHEILVHKKYWASVSVIDSIKGICGEERVWVS
jgi:DNA polymerase-3 subunit alpha